MLKNKHIYIFALILIAIVTIAISVVVSAYNKDKPISPNNNIDVLSLNDMAKIKVAYESEDNKKEFIELCETIELAVANKLLDGSVTNDTQLGEAINKINNILKTDDWSYIGLESSTYWMGTWNIDSEGTLTFTFKDENIKPSWASHEEVQKYIR